MDRSIGPSGPAGEAGSKVTHWDGASATTLSEALAPPTIQCIEADLADRNVRIITARKSPDCLSLTLTTKSAYRTPVVKVFINAVADRTHFSTEMRERIQTAVQEALMNAVLHGNLKIEPHLRNSLESLMVVHDQIEAQLALENIARSMIRVQAIWSATTLHVLIRDGGSGFQPTDEPPSTNKEADEERASGRGLAILNAVCDRFALIEGGRTAKMSFTL